MIWYDGLYVCKWGENNNMMGMKHPLFLSLRFEFEVEVD